MARLEDLTVGTCVSGVVPGSVVTIKSVGWTGNQAVEVIFEDVGGAVGSRAWISSRATTTSRRSCAPPPSGTSSSPGAVGGADEVKLSTKVASMVDRTWARSHKAATLLGFLSPPLHCVVDRRSLPAEESLG